MSRKPDDKKTCSAASAKELAVQEQSQAKVKVLDEFEVPNWGKARFVKEGDIYRLEGTSAEKPGPEDWVILGGGVGRYAAEFKSETKAKQAWKAFAVVIVDDDTFFNWIACSNKRWPNLPK